MNRGTRGFTEAERELLDLVRPHLSQAFRDAQMRGAVDPLSDERLTGLGLTPREAEVMRLLVGGDSATAVAAGLGISVHTARNHIASIYDKLEVGTRAAAVSAVLRGPELAEAQA
jgi:DNA-binding CsgD family transcriptional regulator